jgi:AmiR/NasT family two-component response regulator
MRIVIADDEPLIRLEVRVLLESLGHEVVGEADNGRDGVLVVRRTKPDAAILDVRMPAMDGIDAAAKISQDRVCPVILLTAYSEPDIVSRSVEAGVLAFLVKPFREAELSAALEIAGARFRELVAIEGQRDGLTEELETRRAVARARTVLVGRHGITDQEALRRMKAQSLGSGRTLRQIAEAIVLTSGMDMPGR